MNIGELRKRYHDNKDVRRYLVQFNDCYAAWKGNAGNHYPYGKMSRTLYEETIKQVVSELETPQLFELLESLSSDYSCVEHSTFDDFCSDLGYNNDSIKHRAIYDACLQNGIKLKKVLGQTALNYLREIEW